MNTDFTNRVTFRNKNVVYFIYIFTRLVSVTALQVLSAWCFILQVLIVSD